MNLTFPSPLSSGSPATQAVSENSEKRMLENRILPKEKLDDILAYNKTSINIIHPLDAEHVLFKLFLQIRPNGSLDWFSLAEGEKLRYLFETQLDQIRDQLVGPPRRETYNLLPEAEREHWVEP